MHIKNRRQCTCIQLKLNQNHFQKRAQLINFIKKCSFHVYATRQRIHCCHQKTGSKIVSQLHRCDISDADGI